MSRITLETKREIYDKHGGECAHCGRQTVFLGGWTWKRVPLPNDATMDHIIPKSKGGSNRKENLLLSCKECNEERADMSIEEYYTHKGITL